MEKRQIKVIDKSTGADIIRPLDVTMWDELRIVKEEASLTEEFSSNSDVEVQVVDIEEEQIQQEGCFVSPAHWQSFRPLKDSTYNITLNVSAPSDGNVVSMHRMMNTTGYIIYKSMDGIKEEDFKMLDEQDEVWEKKKSPSKQLSDVFFRIWEYDKEGFEEFKDYYRHKMSKLKTHYLKILDDKKQ